MQKLKNSFRIFHWDIDFILFSILFTESGTYKPKEVKACKHSWLRLCGS